MTSSKFTSNMVPEAEPKLVPEAEPKLAMQVAVPDFDSDMSLWGEHGLAVEPAPEPGTNTEEAASWAFGRSEEENVEFELWVETEIDAAWCLPGEESKADGAAADSAVWRQECTTSTLRRRWEDFDTMNPKSLLPGDKTLVEALGKLGLPPQTNEVDAEMISSAFRKMSLTCHPDKAAAPDKAKCVERFNALVSAYEVAQRALTDKSCGLKDVQRRWGVGRGSIH